MCAACQPSRRLAAAAVACASCCWRPAPPAAHGRAPPRRSTAILAGDQRSAEERARDVYRHPKETLLFFGIRPEMSVLEVWPEPGWYTEVIAPLLRDKGKYYAAVIAADPTSKYITQRLDEYRAKLASRPELYDRVVVVSFPADGGDVVPPGSLDMVVTFRNIHNWMARDDAAQAFAIMYRALKPGGVLGVVEHRGNPALPQDPQGQERLRQRGLRHQADRGAGFSPGRQVRGERQPEGHQGLRAGGVDAAADLPPGREGPRQVRRYRRERSLHAALREAAHK